MQCFIDFECSNGNLVDKQTSIKMIDGSCMSGKTIIQDEAKFEDYTFMIKSHVYKH